MASCARGIWLRQWSAGPEPGVVHQQSEVGRSRPESSARRVTSSYRSSGRPGRPRPHVWYRWPQVAASTPAADRHPGPPGADHAPVRPAARRTPLPIPAEAPVTTARPGGSPLEAAAGRRLGGACRGPRGRWSGAGLCGLEQDVVGLAEDEPHQRPASPPSRKKLEPGTGVTPISRESQTANSVSSSGGVGPGRRRQVGEVGQDVVRALRGAVQRNPDSINAPYSRSRRAR